MSTRNPDKRYTTFSLLGVYHYQVAQRVYMVKLKDPVGREKRDGSVKTVTKYCTVIKPIHPSIMTVIIQWSHPLGTLCTYVYKDYSLCNKQQLCYLSLFLYSLYH
jgi:hypothetical protein